MVLYGFVKKDAKAKYQGKTIEERRQFLEKLKKKLGEQAFNAQASQDADHDYFEIVKDQMMMVEYPTPISRYHLVYESQNLSIEPLYYWALGHLQYDLGFPWVEKITDLFTASEQSSFYGAAAQRLGLAQDKVQQFLAAIGGFIRKDLFQLVRDVRWIDERLTFHEDARKSIESAEVTLKGIWTDIVDGVVQGQRVHANVFMMAQQLQFTTLPDYFFSLHPKKIEEIDPAVEKLKTTKVVANVLKRKLEQYLVWRESNHEELKQRKLFELRYLRQHYHIIKMYMAWVKPYLKHIERLRTDVTKLSSPELVSAFEGSMVEIEILASRMPEGNKNVHSCVLLTFEYRTRPSLTFAQEGGYHRGPVHVGQTRMTWRSYAWNKDQIENFRRMKEKEDFELLGEIDSSIKATMDAIGDDLWKYLEQAEKAEPLKPEEEKKEEEARREGLFEPLLNVFKGFGELGGLVTPFKKKPGAKKEDISEEEKTATEDAKKVLFTHYKNFKSGNGMYKW